MVKGVEGGSVVPIRGHPHIHIHAHAHIPTLIHVPVQ